MSEPYLGQLMCVGFNFNNRGWSNCDGQILPISQHTALFSLFGTMYGGDGRTTFGLPELRGRVPIHTGQGAGLPNYMQGSKGGSPTVVLNTTQIPSHDHVLVNGTNANQAYVRVGANAANAGTQTPTDNVLATSRENTYLAGQAADVQLAESSAAIGGQTALTGGNQDHQNMQPYQTLRWLVAMVGQYPSRN
jgi:microcystin-dependent protein